jgi:hypothetical protein
MKCLESVIRDSLSEAYTEEKIDEIIELLYLDLDAFIGEKIEDTKSDCESEKDFIIKDLEDELGDLKMNIIELEDELSEIRKYVPYESLQDYMKLEWIRKNWDTIPTANFY